MNRISSTREWINNNQMVSNPVPHLAEDQNTLAVDFPIAHNKTLK